MYLHFKNKYIFYCVFRHVRAARTLMAKNPTVCLLLQLSVHFVTKW
jgi:hypothetical protein